MKFSIIASAIVTCALAKNIETYESAKCSTKTELFANQMGMNKAEEMNCQNLEKIWGMYNEKEEEGKSSKGSKGSKFTEPSRPSRPSRGSKPSRKSSKPSKKLEITENELKCFGKGFLSVIRQKKCKIGKTDASEMLKKEGKYWVLFVGNEDLKEWLEKNLKTIGKKEEKTQEDELEDEMDHGCYGGGRFYHGRRIGRYNYGRNYGRYNYGRNIFSRNFIVGLGQYRGVQRHACGLRSCRRQCPARFIQKRVCFVKKIRIEEPRCIRELPERRVRVDVRVKHVVPRIPCVRYKKVCRVVRVAPKCW